MNVEERYAHLLVKAADGRMSPEERAQFQAALAEHPELAVALELQTSVARDLDLLGHRLRSHEASMPSPHRAGDRLLFTAGVIAAGGGGAGLLAYGLPVFGQLLRTGPGLALLSLGAGLALLTFRLIRARLRAADPYEEIQR